MRCSIDNLTFWTCCTGSIDNYIFWTFWTVSFLVYLQVFVEKVKKFAQKFSAQKNSKVKFCERSIHWNRFWFNFTFFQYSDDKKHEEKFVQLNTWRLKA